MLLVSNRQLIHRQKIRPAGIPFEEQDDKTAEDLIRRGVARKADPPQVLYETKPAIFEVPEVKPETGVPFRNVPLSDEEPAAVVTASNPVLPQPDVQEQGTADNLRRGTGRGTGKGNRGRGRR